MKASWWYHIVAFLVVVVWGSTFVFTKLLLLNGLSPAQIFTLRFVIAYLLLLGYELLFARKSFRFFSDSLKDELMMLMLGITGGSLYFLTENEALNYTATTNVSLIVCCCPLVTALLVSIFYRSQRLRPLQIFGTLMAAVGVVAVVLNGHFVLHLSPVGDLLALGANLCWAVYSLLLIPANRRVGEGEHERKKYGAVFITRKVFFYGLLTMIPYFLMVPDWPSWQVIVRPQVLGNLLYLGIVASCVCFLVWTWVMDKLGAIIATNYVYVNPISTIIFASVLLNEQITFFFLAGTLLILSGMYLTDRK
jgi:drug/metabolite transporter (DMT)-like permease